MANLTRLSKFLALALRHKPDDFGLVLDDEGFTDVDGVWALVQQRYPGQYEWPHLLQVVEGDQHGKRRYELQDGRIRALFGHSQPVVVYPTAVPPERLYHGTTPEALESIRQRGLESRGRQFVHLTTNLDNATRVAQRRTRSAVILEVRAREAHDAGIVFHHPEEEHYLTKHIPAAFIVFDD